MPPDVQVALIESFVGNVPGDVRVEASEGLGEKLAGIVMAARGAWPSVDVPDEDFVAHMATHATGDVEEWLDRVRGEDLWLAYACSRGDKLALDAFERSHGSQMQVLAERLVSPELAQEVVQVLRQQLLVGDGERPPGIAKYAGQGKLKGWLRVTTVREAVRVRKKHGLEVPSEEQALEGAGARGIDPELRYMKELYKAEFREAFTGALAALTARERTLLRYHVIDGLTVDRVGVIYRVHRATAARWIAAARERLVDETRRELTRRLAVAAPEQESILRLIRSDLDLSIRSFLNEEAS